MASNVFSVDSYIELQALQRVFREAKFCFDPSDLEISPSPVVARMYGRLIAVLVDVNVEKYGESSREDMIRWLTIDPTRSEWQVAVSRARGDETWRNLTDAELSVYIETLFAPFIISPELIAQFMLAIRET